MEFALPAPDELAQRVSSSMWAPVDVVPSTGSTNSDLAALARQGAPEGRVLVAGQQTAGRGRLARQWASPEGASVSISLLLAPTRPADEWGWLSLLAGLAVRDALTGLAPDAVAVSLKWPNDVLLDGRKVCGILSERVEHASGPRAVVGMGVNVALTEDQLPVPTATSLSMAGFEATASDVVAGILLEFERHYGRWQRDGELRDVYEPSCASVGAQLTITPSGGTPKEGVGVGVDATGQLLVRTSDGVEAFAVGDVVHATLA